MVSERLDEPQTPISWRVQQLRVAFPFDSAPRFLIFDRDSKYGAEVPAAVPIPDDHSPANLVRVSLASAGSRVVGVMCWTR